MLFPWMDIQERLKINALVPENTDFNDFLN